MDVLKRQIEEKKRKLEEQKASAGKKYLTKADLDREREAKYLEEQRAAEEERRLRQQRKQAEAEAALRAGRPKRETELAIEKELTCTMPVEEVKRRLRRLRQPVTLFGESDALRERRLIELEAGTVEDEMREAGGRNEFLEDLRAADEGVVVDAGDQETRGDFLSDSRDENIARILQPPDPGMSQEKYFAQYMQRLLRIWEQEIAALGPAHLQTIAGRQEWATLKQTRRWLRPLWKKLEGGKESMSDQFEHFWHILNALRDCNYVLANDWYIRLAVGNAAWPMGVTMVGIHERSAREKIFQSQTAHILNDEVTRCYIQAIKRLMSYQEKILPGAAAAPAAPTT